MIESISAITLATHDMPRAVRFYRMLGFEVIFGGDEAAFTSFRAGRWRNDVQKPHRQVKSERPRRQRETSQRKKQRSPTMDYAAQPFLGGSRPWF
jgi:catechol 2,3-dioxygenase-like lactoylglutathione lyase family enzyme